MPSILRKQVKGKYYWQIVEYKRIDGIPKTIVIKHLGPTEKLLEIISGSPDKANVLNFGLICALLDIATEIDLVSIIDQHVPKQDRENALSCGHYCLLAILSRVAAHTSKRGISKWYERSILSCLNPVPSESLTSQNFWNNMNLLDDEKLSQIEEAISDRVDAISSPDSDMLLFDATNFDTYLDTRNSSKLAKRGKAKSKRSDLKIVGLALLVSRRDQIPLLSYVYPGNMNDKKMFSQLMKNMVKRIKKLNRAYSKTTVVFDGGNVSEVNMKYLVASKIHFVTSLTVTSHKDLLSIPLKKFNTYTNNRLNGTIGYRSKIQLWEKKLTVIIIRSQTFYEGQLRGIETSLSKKRGELKELKLKLMLSQNTGTRGKRYTIKSLENRLKVITSGQFIKDILKYEIEVKPRLSFKFHTDQKAYIQLKTNRLGKRIICTTRHGWLDEDIITAYRDQAAIEEVYKFSKNHDCLGFRPFYHWTDSKIKVQVFFGVILVQLMMMLFKRVRTFSDFSKEEMCDQLSNIFVVQNIYASGNDFRCKFIPSSMNEQQSLLFEKLGLRKFLELLN